MIPAATHEEAAQLTDGAMALEHSAPAADRDRGPRLTREQAVEFFSTFYGGEHHIPGPGRLLGAQNVKPCGFGFMVSHSQHLASYDNNDLTRLVLLAHDRCVRVEVSPYGLRRLKIAIWARRPSGDFSVRHPTIEAAIEQFRSRGAR